MERDHPHIILRDIGPPLSNKARGNNAIKDWNSQPQNQMQINKRTYAPPLSENVRLYAQAQLLQNI